MSGNVSLYNETNGQGILPTPTIGAVGLVEDVRVRASIGFKREGDALILIGATQGWLGQSIYLHELCGRDDGAPPPVDLAAEKRNGDFVRQLIRSRQIDTVHDCSDGGLALAVAEMAIAGGIGATIAAAPEGLPLHAFLFGEDQGRYVLACDPDEAADLLYEATALGVPATVIGATGGDSLILPSREAISVAELKGTHERWLPAYMATAP